MHTANPTAAYPVASAPISHGSAIAKFANEEVYAQAYPINNGEGVSFSTAADYPPMQQASQTNVREYLNGKDWPVGLQDTFINNLNKIPMRFFICDDSGSMSTSDGHKLTPTGDGQYKLLSCTRWNELTATLLFHAELARLAGAPTEFRLLNNAQPITIGDGSDPDDTKFQALKVVLHTSPSGGTPLCHHIREVTEQIRRLAPGLRAAGQKACVMIATDGESSDGDIAAALRPLKDLPAWVVIRLCTDEDKIVNYWNNVDNELELDMDVLDDLCGEAQEVTEHNPWLTYGDAMHKLREFGIPVKEIDLLDESRLSVEQIRLFCSLIFGGSIESYPHPDLDWQGFKLAITAANEKAPKVWCPIYRRLRPWISVQQVGYLRQGAHCCVAS